MADEKRIVIEIISKGSSSVEDDSSRISTSEGGETGTDASIQYQMAGGINDEIRTAKIKARIASVTALGLMVANSVGGQALRQSNTYFTLTENYKGQQDVSNLKSVANQIGGIAGKIGAGALAGSTFGPIGAGVGASVGATVAAFDILSGFWNTKFEQNLDISSKGYSVEYNRNLAGLIAGDSRNTEN